MLPRDDATVSGRGFPKGEAPGDEQPGDSLSLLQGNQHMDGNSIARRGKARRAGRQYAADSFIRLRTPLKAVHGLRSVDIPQGGVDRGE
jgi:hypothetical protein